jgi:hypothetical protein
MAIGSFSLEYSGQGVKFTTNLNLLPRLRMSGAIPLLLLHAFLVTAEKKFTF